MLEPLDAGAAPTSEFLVTGPRRRHDHRLGSRRALGQAGCHDPVDLCHLRRRARRLQHPAGRLCDLLRRSPVGARDPVRHGRRTTGSSGTVPGSRWPSWSPTCTPCAPSPASASPRADCSCAPPRRQRTVHRLDAGRDPRPGQGGDRPQQLTSRRSTEEPPTASTKSGSPHTTSWSRARDSPT